MTMTIRNASPSDAPFLAKCLMAGLHIYDFENETPESKDVFRRFTECAQSDNMLYTYRYSRIAEVDGQLAGALLSYPGEIYKELRQRTFTEPWPDFANVDGIFEQETGPGEFYLDTLAVLPSQRGQGIGRALIHDAIERGISLGYDKITLLVDPGMPHLIRLYSSVGFTLADRCHAFGIDFQRMVYSRINKASASPGKCQ